MGQPVVHFEIIGKDGTALQSFYADLFGWEIDADNPMNYGMVTSESNKAADGGLGIAGGVGQAPDGMDPHVTFYIAVPSVETALAKAADLGGTRIMGPDQVPGGPELGMFRDPEGNLIGVVADHNAV